MKFGFVVLAASAFLSAATAHAAPFTFAQFEQKTTADTFELTNGAGSTGTIKQIGTSLVNFSFLLPSLQEAGLGMQDAYMTISGNITTPANLMNIPGPKPIFQLIDSGTITFTRATPAPKGPGNGMGTNLLTISFTNAMLTGTSGGTSGSLLASTPDSAMTFTSDFLDFEHALSLDFAIALSSITGGGLGRTSTLESLRAFKADSTGSFSSDPAPLSTVPEPAALGLMGLGLAGLAWRRRRKAA